MISFSHIAYLAKQHSFIQKKIGSNNAVFLVGGCIRNILLGIEKRPNDIDATLAGNPLDIYNNIKKSGLSHFMTEKFGTITLIKKSKKEKNNEIKYEITPLRTESNYEDFRHPGEINRCNDVLLDAKRRDFTINALYFFSDTTESNKGEQKPQNITSENEILNGLKQNGIVGITEHNTIIIQNHDIINCLFKDGNYHKEQLNSIIKQYELGTESDYKYFVLDPCFGIQDILRKKLRAVGNPDARFQEDALRLLRGLRFVNMLNQQIKQKQTTAPLFDFDKETRNSIKRNHKLLNNVAKERIKDELVKIFIKGNPFGFIALLDETNLLQDIFPSLYATKYIHQPVRYHPFDVYTHTLLTLYELQQLNTNYLVRLGMLYHDVGKVAQFSAYKEELTKDDIRTILSGPLNHRKGGPDLVKKDFTSLGFSNKEIEDIAWYVANHHKPEEILDGEKPENCKKKLRKFLSEAGYQKVNDILDITIADRRGQYNPLQNNTDLEEITYLRNLLNQLHSEEGQFTIQQLTVNGNDIITHFQLNPGRIIGELLNKAFDWVINDIKKRNKKREIFAHLAGYLKNRKGEISETIQ